IASSNGARQSKLAADVHRRPAPASNLIFCRKSCPNRGCPRVSGFPAKPCTPQPVRPSRGSDEPKMADVLWLDTRHCRHRSRRPASETLHESGHRTVRSWSARALHGTLLNNLVGAGEDGRWYREAELFSGVEIDNGLEFGRLLDRQIGRLGAL